jgi:hypothetical protein
MNVNPPPTLKTPRGFPVSYSQTCKKHSTRNKKTGIATDNTLLQKLSISFPTSMARYITFRAYKTAHGKWTLTIKKVISQRFLFLRAKNMGTLVPVAEPASIENHTHTVPDAQPRLPLTLATTKPSNP